VAEIPLPQNNRRILATGFATQAGLGLQGPNAAAGIDKNLARYRDRPAQPLHIPVASNVARSA
jgi:hypothetical protein